MWISSGILPVWELAKDTVDNGKRSFSLYSTLPWLSSHQWLSFAYQVRLSVKGNVMNSFGASSVPQAIRSTAPYQRSRPPMYLYAFREAGPFFEQSPPPMSTSNAEIEQQCASLRLELKAWERQFSADNEGRKPSNKDIKADAQIGRRHAIA